MVVMIMVLTCAVIGFSMIVQDTYRAYRSAKEAQASLKRTQWETTWYLWRVKS